MAKLEIFKGWGSKMYIPKSFYRTGGSKTYIPKIFYTKTTYITLLAEKFGGSNALPAPSKHRPFTYGELEHYPTRPYNTTPILDTINPGRNTTLSSQSSPF
ncbi:hypothetical protein Hanom_Chr08g00692121 [Helianthus anomalus]